MAQVDRGIGTNALDTTYIRQQSIEMIKQSLLMGDVVTPGNLPKNAGSTLRWTINEPITNAAGRFNALTSGAGEADYSSAKAPNEAAWVPSVVNKQMDYYGEFIPVRQVDLDWMPKSVMDDLTESVGYAGAETLNGLDAAQIDGRGNAWDPSQGTGTSNIYLAGGGASLAAANLLTAEDIFNVKGSLAAANIPRFKDGYYRAFITPQAAIHLQTDVSTTKVTWSEINKYVSGRTGQEKLLTGNNGAVGGVMVFETTDLINAAQDTTSAYHNIVVGKHGLGGGRMGDMDVQVLINRSDASSTDDPYRLFATVAYRLKAAETMLREAACWLLKSSDGSGT